MRLRSPVSGPRDRRVLLLFWVSLYRSALLCSLTLFIRNVWTCPLRTRILCSWISFFGLPIKSYSGLRPLVYNKYTLKEPDSRLRPIELLGCKNTKNNWQNKIKLDLDLDSVDSRGRLPLIHEQPSSQKQSHQERESPEPDENSKSMLECLSSWWQVLKEWRRWSRRCSSYGCLLVFAVLVRMLGSFFF